MGGAGGGDGGRSEYTCSRCTINKKEMQTDTDKRDGEGLTDIVRDPETIFVTPSDKTVTKCQSGHCELLIPTY